MLRIEKFFRDMWEQDVKVIAISGQPWRINYHLEDGRVAIFNSNNEDKLYFRVLEEGMLRKPLLGEFGKCEDSYICCSLHKDLLDFVNQEKFFDIKERGNDISFQMVLNSDGQEQCIVNWLDIPADAKYMLSEEFFEIFTVPSA